jgi:hypothetical protein
VPSLQTTVGLLLGGTTTVVCSGGEGLLLLMHPEIPARSGNRIRDAIVIFFMAVSFGSLLRELRGTDSRSLILRYHDRGALRRRGAATADAP